MGRFESVADVSFMGNITLSSLKELGIKAYIDTIQELTGKTVTIPDENKAIIYAAAQIFYQIAEAIDTKARQNLLKYATGDYLDNIALSKGLQRKAAEKAVVTVRFTLSAVRPDIIAIPKGTRVTSAATKVYFETTEYTEIAPGESYIDIECTAIDAGAAGNSFTVGELNVLADPIAYIAKVSNTDTPTGGTDTESDDDFAERIFDARNIYSTTGSKNSYIYYTKSFSTLIDDVVVTNPKDAEIYIYILMKDREQATPPFLETLKNYLDNDEIRPLTDNITVQNVVRVPYDIDVSYAIYETDTAKLTEIDAAVTAAVEKYKEWQSEKIGRDINNQKLISLMIAAGAAKVTVTTPDNTRVTPEQIAYCNSTNITYAGYIEE